MAKFAENNGIRLTKKGLLDISISNNATEVMGTFQNGKNPPSAILLINDHGEIFPNTYSWLNLDDGCTQSSVDENQQKKQRPHRSSVLPKLSDRCPLFHEFESGTRRLHHGELGTI